MAALQHGFFFPLTLDGIEAAEHELRKLKKALTSNECGASPPRRATTTPALIANPAVVLYEATNPNHRSRELIAALGKEGRTFAELSPKITPNDDGKPLSEAQVRAVYRNVKRQENSLRKGGKLIGPVVRADFDGYETDQVGRYALSADDLAALDAHLGR